MTQEAPASDEKFSGNHWVLPTDIELVGPADKAFVERLVLAGFDENSDEVANMVVAFREALINAIAHGNLGVALSADSSLSTIQMAKEAQENNPTDKKVHIDIDIDSDKVSVTIEDEGPGFDWKAVTSPKTTEQILAEILRPSGRGVTIMGGFFDEVVYNQSGNKVTMIKYRQKVS